MLHEFSDALLNISTIVYVLVIVFKSERHTLYPKKEGFCRPSGVGCASGRSPSRPDALANQPFCAIVTNRFGEYPVLLESKIRKFLFSMIDNQCFMNNDLF